MPREIFFASRAVVHAFLLTVVLVGLNPTLRAQHLPLPPELKSVQGLCVQVGLDEDTLRQLVWNDRLLVHCLEPDRENVKRMQQTLSELDGTASFQLEHWTKDTLPHASNLANLLIVHNDQIGEEEVERVLRPGGIGLMHTSGGVKRIVKSPIGDVDEWTHQWHAADGGLASNDTQVGVPTGVQWISGPLFAMAGRKSSTQTLVTAGGINFYVTQNVQENLGLPVEQMGQFLIAMDSYNGLLLWKRPWTGPFVTGNGETNPRMIASDDALFAVTAPRTVVAIAPKTGETISRFQLGDRHDVQKIAKHDKQVLVQSKDRLTAIDQNLQATKWHFDGERLSALTLVDDRIFLISSGRSGDGRFLHELICLNAINGKVIFRQNTQPNVTAARVRINFATDQYVALQAHGSLHMFHAGNGEHLWTRNTEARPGKTYVDERYVGHFFRRGLVWMLSRNSPRESTGQNLWLALDPATGETLRELETTGVWPRTETPAKMGCQVLIASDRYIMIPRQATFIDFDTGEKHSFKFTRGGCGLGFVPANGLLYSHPHACGCFSEAIRGFMGMHSRSQQPSSSQDEDQRLHFVQTPRMLTQPPSTDSWTTHRGDGARSGFADSTLGDQVSVAWTTQVAGACTTPSRRGWMMRTGNAVSAPTISESYAFVADVDAGRITALNADSGRGLWTFDAAGRIDTPPTVYRGLCVFGSHDGYVYCLQADNGRLCWKYRVAPSDQRIIAYSGVESTWPVAGSALVRDGLVYVAAGRAPDADGGIYAMALELATGKPVWQRRLNGGAFRGLNDLFVNGKQHVYLANWRFDPKTGVDEQTPELSTHLRGGKAGLLEASWTKHDLAIRKDIQTWTANGMAGQILAWSAGSTAAYDAANGKLIIDGERPFDVGLPVGGQVTSIAMTRDHLVVAGGEVDGKGATAGFLQVISLRTGQTVSQLSLSAEACFDGIAIAGQRIYVSTQDGRLHCLEAE